MYHNAAIKMVQLKVKLLVNVTIFFMAVRLLVNKIDHSVILYNN